MKPAHFASTQGIDAQRGRQWLCAVLLAALSHPSFAADELSAWEKRMGTDSSEARRTHTLLAEPARFRCDTFQHPPDFVVGIEKTSAAAVRESAPADGGMNLAAVTDIQRTSIRKLLKGDTLLTHSLRLSRKPNGDARIQTLPSSPAPAGTWTAARDTLATLQKEVAKLVAERKATHVILFSAGWHMEQADAVAGAGWMLDSLHAESARTGARFAPVTIALTWPAGPREISILGKITQLSDYPQRSELADEIGIVWGSRIIESVVIPAAGHARTIVLGHSLGARLLTTATAARAMLPAAERTGKGRKVDCLIGLQAAFPRDRFIHEDEDAPGGSATKGVYSGIFAEVNRALFTTSANDRMVSTAGAARNLPLSIGRAAPAEHYMGSYMTSADIPGYPAFSNAFAPMWITGDLVMRIPRAKNQVIVADCSAIIGSHNDVWGNAELARLIFAAIR